MTLAPEALLAIVLMGAATLAIRMAGLLLADRLPRRGFFAAWLAHVPGAVLAAIVAPGLAAGGPAEWLAGAIAAASYLLTRNLLVTIIAGVLAVYVLRMFLPPLA